MSPRHGCGVPVLQGLLHVEDGSLGGGSCGAAGWREEGSRPVPVPATRILSGQPDNNNDSEPQRPPAACRVIDSQMFAVALGLENAGNGASFGHRRRLGATGGPRFALGCARH